MPAAGSELVTVCGRREPVCLPHAIRRRLVYAVRAAVEITHGLAYFGKRVSMGGNQVSVFDLARGESYRRENPPAASIRGRTDG